MNSDKKANIGRERIEILFEEAEQIWEENPRLSKRYINLAKRIAQKTQTPLSRKFKLKHCSNCSQILIEGKNCTKRIENKNIIKICDECSHKNKFKIKGTEERTK